MGLLTSRRAKIRSHTHARLAQQAREQMEERLNGATGGLSSIHDGRLGGSDALGMPGAMQRERRRFSSIHVPTRKLLALALYSLLVLLLSSPWISSSPLFSRLHIGSQSLNSAGSALSAALTMVTGLLIGYRSNQALRKWERGREVWMVQLRSEVRDALRMISLIGPREPHRPARPRLLHRESSSESAVSSEPIVDRSTLLDQRSQELLELVVAFVFALQHHLDGTRPTLSVPSADPSAKYPPVHTPVDPLVDLLPLGYIASLRRTPARVRFADSDEDAESSGSSQGSGAVDYPASGETLAVPGRRGGSRRGNGSARDGSRSPSPRTAAIRARMRSGATIRTRGGASSDDGSRPERGSIGLSSALAPARSFDADGFDASTSPGRPASHREISIQLAQLNVPGGSADPEANGTADGISSSRRNRMPNPVLSSRHPRNLPLAVLRLMQSYVDEFAREGERDKVEGGSTAPQGADQSPEEPAKEEASAHWGWSASQAEKGWSAVRSFSKILAEAELLSEDPPPLSLSTHLRVLLTLFLASIPLTAVPALGRGGIIIALVAGWAFLGLEQAAEELGGVFGGGANHIPIRAYAYRILDESLRSCPPFKRAYSARVRLRTGVGLDDDASGSGDEGVGAGSRSDAEGDSARARSAEWLPSF